MNNRVAKASSPLSLVERRAVELAESLLSDERTVRLFIFGSYATGQAFPRSDSDVGIDLGHPVAPDIVAHILEAFEGLPIFQKVDVVDFSEVDDGFKSVSLKRIKTLYERKAA